MMGAGRGSLRCARLKLEVKPMEEMYANMMGGGVEVGVEVDESAVAQLGQVAIVFAIFIVVAALRGMI